MTMKDSKTQLLPRTVNHWYNYISKTPRKLHMSKSNALTDADLKAIGDIIENKLDDRFDQFTTKYLTHYDKLITKIDKSIGKLQAARDTQEIHAYRHKDITDKFEDHDQRIKSIETLVKTSTN